MAEQGQSLNKKVSFVEANDNNQSQPRKTSQKRKKNVNKNNESEEPIESTRIKEKPQENQESKKDNNKSKGPSEGVAQLESGPNNSEKSLKKSVRKIREAKDQPDQGEESSPKRSAKKGVSKQAEQTIDKSQVPEINLFKRQNSKGLSRRGSLRTGDTESSFKKIVLKESGEDDSGRNERDEEERLLREERKLKLSDALKIRENSPVPGDFSMVEVKENARGVFEGCILKQEHFLPIFKFTFNFKFDDIFDKKGANFRRKSNHERRIIMNGKDKQETQEKLKRLDKEYTRQTIQSGMNFAPKESRFVDYKNFFKMKEYSHVRGPNSNDQIKNLREDFAKLRGFSYFFLRLLM
jgi:hypothetical protein